MEIRVAGDLSNVRKALTEVRHLYAGAPKAETRGDSIPEEMLDFLLGLLRVGESRPLFLKLMTITLDITAPEEWWSQAHVYFERLEWVRRHPATDEERSLLSQEDFEGGIPSMLLDTLNEYITTEQRELLASSMPENFLRRGYAITNYAELRRLYQERGHYNKGHWHDLALFISRLPYGELLTEAQ